MKYVSILLLILVSNLNAQQLINGDLEGDVYSDAQLPNGWDKIKFTNEITMANCEICDTPDLTNTAAPFGWMGVPSSPYSGQSFVTGVYLESNINNNVFQEGIEQTVTGFTVDKKYSINFHQSTTKQHNALDSCGYWMLFVDDEFIGNSMVTCSQLEFNSFNIDWQFRSIEFCAKNTIHKIQLLVGDDDGNLNPDSEDGGLRMGIDSLFISEVIISNLDTNEKELTNIYPNPVESILKIECRQCLNTVSIELLGIDGVKYLNQIKKWEEGRVKIDIGELPSGLYIVKLKSGNYHYISKIYKK